MTQFERRVRVGLLCFAVLVGLGIWEFVTEPFIRQNERAPFKEVDLKSDLPEVLFKHDEAVERGETVVGLHVQDNDWKPPQPHPLAAKTVAVIPTSLAYTTRTLNLIGSLQMIHPWMDISVWFLGSSPVPRKLLDAAKVTVFHPFEESDTWPAHVLNLNSYAFKGVVLNAARRTFNGRPVLLLDGGFEIWQPLTPIFDAMIRDQYFLTVQRTPASLIHPTSLQVLLDRIGNDIDNGESDLRKQLAIRPHVSSGLIGVMPNPGQVVEKLLSDWFDCCMDVNCIAPVGANLDNHKFDQSVLSVLVLARGLVVHQDINRFAGDWSTVRFKSLASDMILFSRRHHCPKPYASRVKMSNFLAPERQHRIGSLGWSGSNAFQMSEKEIEIGCGWWRMPLVIVHASVALLIGCLLTPLILRRISPKRKRAVL